MYLSFGSSWKGDALSGSRGTVSRHIRHDGRQLLGVRSGNDLDETSRAALRAVDLTFHDLRHEAGSRLLEAGWQLHTVAHMLGHANISQTSTYLNATRVGLQDAMRRLDASRCKPVASKTEIDRAPHSNEDEATGTQVVVN